MYTALLIWNANHYGKLYAYGNIHYFSSIQVIWSHILCLELIFPEPEARGIFNPDNVFETILPFWSWNNIFVVLQVLHKTPFLNGIVRVVSSFFYLLSNLKTFCTIKRSQQRMVYSKWINQKNAPIEQILNSKDVEARETFPTFENCTRKTFYGVKNNGFSWLHNEVSLTSRAIYTASAVNMKPLTPLNNQWDSHNVICSMTITNIRKHNLSLTIQNNFLLEENYFLLLKFVEFVLNQLKIYKKINFRNEKKS